MTGLVDLIVLDRGVFAEGESFGGAGPYEWIEAEARFALDPAAQSGLYDIDLAPLDGAGLVRFAADIRILKPARGNGALMLELPNRGNQRCLQFFNDAPGTNRPRTAAHAGNGFLMRQGYTVVAAAWQGDVLPGDGRLTARLPVAQGAAPARVVAEFICETPGVTCLPLSGKHGTRSHPTVSLDTRRAELRRRRYPWSATGPVAAADWQFARTEGGGRGGPGDITGAELGILPSDSHIYLPAGFEPGWIYELVYEARDPLILDLGFAAVRDFVSGVRRGAPGTAELAGLTRFLAWGRSQSGRAIRDFIHRGFNDDQGRKVFDGMIPHIAGGGRTSMNRFSNLVVAASRQYEDWLNPADRFPFSYATSVDHLTGAEDGILKRPATDPLVIHTHTASEYWSRRGSLVHTDTSGNDLPQPAGVRVYFWSSSQHWSDPLPARPTKGICQNFQNVVATSALFRATLTLMDDWVRDGIEPPPSQVPRVADGTLLTPDVWRRQFPAIPGTALPAGPNLLPVVDYGPAFAEGGPAADAPTVDMSRQYAVMVPAVDADGNDRAGVRAPMAAAPLGTYTGWNPRAAGHGTGALHDFSGSYIPLPETAEERSLSQDPRPAILERYGSQAGYEAAIRVAAEDLVARRFLLAEDVAWAAHAARDWGRPRHATHLTDED